jgi:hypothetical protein
VPAATSLETRMMMDRRFEIGETVHLCAIARRALGGAKAFKILSVFPREGRSREYRIRCELEPYERVVTEAALRAGMTS